MTATLQDATAALKAGGVIAYPSESVFGLGCLPSRLDAVQRLLTIKGRDQSKGFILVGRQLDDFSPWIAPLSAEQQTRITAPTPRPTTWLVPADSETSPLLTGGSSRIAIRISDHPVIQSLCAQLQQAIISTSANFSGETPARQADKIDANLAAQLDFIVDAPCGQETRPSRICDLASGEILRD